MTWVLNSVPTKAAGEIFLSNPYLKDERRVLQKKGQFDGAMLWCQEPWCRETFIQGLVTTLTSVCGKRESAAALECLLARQQPDVLLLPAGKKRMRTNIFLKMGILTSICINHCINKVMQDLHSSPSTYTDFQSTGICPRQRQHGALSCLTGEISLWDVLWECLFTSLVSPLQPHAETPF